MKKIHTCPGVELKNFTKKSPQIFYSRRNMLWFPYKNSGGNRRKHGRRTLLRYPDHAASDARILEPLELRFWLQDPVSRQFLITNRIPGFPWKASITPGIPGDYLSVDIHKSLRKHLP
eukprot:1392665-Amorphochlora_amoeboformis.AAC.2